MIFNIVAGDFISNFQELFVFIINNLLVKSQFDSFKKYFHPSLRNSVFTYGNILFVSSNINNFTEVSLHIHDRNNKRHVRYYVNLYKIVGNSYDFIGEPFTLHSLIISQYSLHVIIICLV